MSRKPRPDAEPIRWTSVSTSLGDTFLAATDRGVVRIALPGEGKKAFFRAVLETIPDANLVEDAGSLRKTATQVADFLEGRRKDFDLPLDLRVSPFQGRVLALLRRIPYGKTKSYGEIAAQLGRPKAARAVGLACGRNPLPLVIPCHRVIGADRSLVGFGGGIPLKRKLLTREGALLC